MNITRRRLVAGSIASLPLALAGSRTFAQQPTILKISHQFPSASNPREGDFRDLLCHKFATEVEERTHGALRFQVYPNASLMNAFTQFAGMRRGALDLSLVPLSYAGGEVAETNIGLMPALVPSYEVGAAWKKGDIGRMLTQVVADKGVVILSWIWQAGGVAARTRPLVGPEDAKGMKVRGGSREMDLMLKDAGASVLTLSSNEIYPAMQTGALDAAMTSSTSLISYRLEEVSKFLTTGRGKAYWFMFEPLLMSKQIFDKLPKQQQDILMAVGADLEKFALTSAKADDQSVAGVYTKVGAKVSDLDDASLKKWQVIARANAWKDYAGHNEMCAKLMAAAEKLIA